MRVSKLHATVTLIGLLLAGVPQVATAQEEIEGSLEQSAADAFSKSDWPAAFSLYSELSRVKPDDATSWFRLGAAALNASQDPSIALVAYEKALELGSPPGPTLYGIARANALSSDEDAVLRTLERLAENGPSLGIVERIESEPAFDFLRSRSAFAGLVQRLTPCTSDEYRQFDFWLGTWEVSSPQGAILGRNTITEALDGCLLMESWEVSKDSVSTISTPVMGRGTRRFATTRET